MVGSGIMLVALASLSLPLQAAGLLVGAMALLSGMVVLDRRARTRLMPPDAFWPGSVVGSGLWVVLLMPVAGAMSAVYLVLLLQQLWGYGPTLAGATAAVLSVAWSLSAIAVANVRRIETRRALIISGPMLLGVGLLAVLAGLLNDQVALVVAGQLSVGAGFGMANGYLSLTLMQAARCGERDRVSAMVPTTQSAGNAIGAALAGVAANLAGYAQAVSVTAIEQAIIPVFVLAASMAALGFVAAVRMTRLMGASPQSAAVTP